MELFSSTLLLMAFLFILGFIIVFYVQIKYLILRFHSGFFKTKSPLLTRTITIHGVDDNSAHHQASTGGHVGISEEELERVFALFDKNGDGFITKEEMKESLKNILRVPMSEKEVEEMIAYADTNKDGLIGLEEFLCLARGLMNKSEGGVNEEEMMMREAFDVYDKDKDGMISAEELGIMLRSLGLMMGGGSSDEDVKEMIRNVDDDGDGMVSFEEFKKMMRTH